MLLVRHRIHAHAPIEPARSKKRLFSIECLMLALVLFYYTAHSYADLDKQAVCDSQTSLILAREDCEVLVDLYNATDGDNWKDNTNWGDEDLANWFGVKVRNGKINEIVIPNNRLVGELPVSLSALPDLYVLDLAANLVRGNLSTFLSSSVNQVYLNDTQVTGTLDAVFANPSMRAIDFENAPITGIIPDFNFNNASLFHFNVSGTQVSGTLPDGDYTGVSCRFRDRVRGKRKFDVSNLGLRGPVPAFIEKISCYVDISGNRFSGDLSRFGRGVNVSNQKPYQIENNSLKFLQWIKRSQAGENILLIKMPDGHKFSGISGCEGQSDGVFIHLVALQETCDLSVITTPCETGLNCAIDAGKRHGIANAKIESPSVDVPVSGVVQLRGWLHEPAMRDLYGLAIDEHRFATLSVDGKPTRVSVSLQRDDVAQAMFYGEGQPLSLGWSALFYSGNLENGQHSIALKNEEGLVVDEKTFHVFTPVDANGDTSYVAAFDGELVVQDFPFGGSDSIVKFNAAEQNFVIVDQFDQSDNSFRSLTERFTRDDLQPVDYGHINGVQKVKIETPNEALPLYGVSTIRGWAHGDGDINGSLYLSVDDGEPFLISRDERSDVERAFGVETSNKVGWSQLFYSGNLENGLHRLRLYSEVQGEKILIAQSIFESFTIYSKKRKPVFLSDIHKELEFTGFPFEESRVKLRFDQGGQKFIIVDQVVE